MEENKKVNDHKALVYFVLFAILVATGFYGYYIYLNLKNNETERQFRTVTNEHTKKDPMIGITYNELVKKRGNPDIASPSNDGTGRKMKWCWMKYNPACFYDNNGDEAMDAYDSNINLF